MRVHLFTALQEHGKSRKQIGKLLEKAACLVWESRCPLLRLIKRETGLIHLFFMARLWDCVGRNKEQPKKITASILHA